MTSSSNGMADAITSDTVRLERLLPGPVERLWSYLTEADRRSQWLAGGEMELKPDGAANLIFRHSTFTDEPAPDKYAEMNEKGFISAGRILRCEPPRFLSMTWPGDESASEVSFELAPEGNNVRLVIVHKRLRDTDEMASVASGWHAHLDVLDAALGKRETPPFWSRIDALEESYRARFTQEAGRARM